MNTDQLMNEILAVLQSIQNDKDKLEQIHHFMMDEIYEVPDREEIPEKYRKVVSEIAETIMVGMICFLNTDTLEIEFLPRDMISDPEEFELITGEKWESAEIKHLKWQRYIEVEPMESHESFTVMEYFIDEIDDSNLQNRLINALNRRKPFANFKYIVETSKYRQQWFDFRQKQWEYYVWDILKTNFNILIHDKK